MRSDELDKPTATRSPLSMHVKLPCAGQASQTMTKKSLVLLYSYRYDVFLISNRRRHTFEILYPFLSSSPVDFIPRRHLLPRDWWTLASVRTSATKMVDKRRRPRTISKHKTKGIHASPPPSTETQDCILQERRQIYIRYQMDRPEASVSIGYAPLRTILSQQPQPTPNTNSTTTSNRRV